MHYTSLGSLGVRRHGTGAFHLQAARVVDAGQHVGGKRGIEGQQVLLHHHVADQPFVDGVHAGQDGGVCEADDLVCRHVV